MPFFLERVDFWMLKYLLESFYNYLRIKLCEVVRVVYLGVLSIEKSKTPFGLGHSFF